MADALCGPSNPLQSFRKHTQLDRTLQQDRLVGRANSGEQGFRSHDPRTGSLDADLYAFEHAQPNPLEFQQPPAFGALQQQQQAPPSAGWAADFQRLRISQDPSPVPVSQFRAEAPLVKSLNGGWHNEFLRQSGNITPLAASMKGKEVMRDVGNMGYDMPQQPYMHVSQTPYYPAQNGYAMVNMGQNYGTQQSHEMAHVSDEAFEAAFQDAFMAEAQALQQQEPSPVLHAEHGHESDLVRDEMKIGSDAINYTEMKDRTMDQDTRDADALARTAGQLLNLVQHDTSDKFQNSQFLDLMRKLRDREVAVQNNDMVSTMENPQLATGTVDLQTQPQVSNSTAQQDIYPAATASKENDWMFPDMNDIYAPTNNDLDTASRYYSSDTRARSSSIPRLSSARLSDPTYHTGSDEFPAVQTPRSQIQALHPGGKLYPHSPQQEKAEMSGAVSQNISVDDFEHGQAEESSDLGRRFGSLSQGA